MSAVARALAIGARRLDAQRGLAALGGADAAIARTLASAPIDPLDDPRPRGWRHVDATWIDHALAGEGAQVRAIVTSDRDDPLARWLARWFLGALVPMPPPGGATTVDELPRLAPRALARTLDALGRRQLAHAIAAASPGDQASLIVRLPWGAALTGEIAAVRSLVDAAADLGSRTSALVRTGGLAWPEPIAPVLAGARALAPSMHGDLPAQIAQRLPRPIGVAVLAALTAPGPRDGASPAEVRRAIAHGSVGA